MTILRFVAACGLLLTGPAIFGGVAEAGGGGGSGRIPQRRG